MRHFSHACFALAVLVGCSSPLDQAYEQSRKLNAELQASALKNARQVTIGETNYLVSVVKEGSYSPSASNRRSENVKIVLVEIPYALVTVLDPIPETYTPLDIEAAATEVTGCKSKFAAGVFGALRGFDRTSTNLALLRNKKKDN